jgi:hypothetical protein
LAGGAPGLHIYTLNRANATLSLLQRLTQATARINVASNSSVERMG